MGFAASDIDVLAAAEPQGPFTDTGVIRIGEDVDLDVEWAYQPLALELDGARVVAYNVLPWDPSQIAGDVSRYGPRFVAADPAGPADR